MWLIEGRESRGLTAQRNWSASCRSSPNCKGSGGNAILSWCDKGRRFFDGDISFMKMQIYIYIYIYVCVCVCVCACVCEDAKGKIVCAPI